MRHGICLSWFCRFCRLLNAESVDFFFAGVLAAVAQALIGHDSEAIHQVYVTVGEEALRKAAGAFPDVT